MHWIDSQNSFDKLCQHLKTTSLLAIDTEFERRTTYYPIFALLQISDGESCWLIDTQKVNANKLFVELMANPSVIKIMHSAKEDLEVFFSNWQVKLNGLFDTQIGWSFISGDLSLGYAALVDDLLSVSVSKEETQTDWLQRPLTDAQKAYAAKDVEFLIPMYQIINSKFEAEETKQLFELECQQLCDQVCPSFAPDNDYRQAKEVWKLDDVSLGLFKELFNWRERLARGKNITRNRIIKDQALVHIALVKPTTKRQLSSAVDLHPGSFRQYAAVIIEIVAEWGDSARTALKPVLNPRDVKGLSPAIKNLEQAVSAKAESLGISPTLLASKRLIRQVVYAEICEESKPLSWFGWREQLLGDDLKLATSQS